VPLTFGWIEHRLAIVRVDTAPSAIGIAPGDEVLALDGRLLRDVVADARPYWSISRPDLDMPLFMFMGPRNSTLRLRVRSASGIHEVSLPRSRPFVFKSPVPVVSHPPYTVLPGNIAEFDRQRDDGTREHARHGARRTECGVVRCTGHCVSVHP
jgi:hypothetical protein